MDCMVNDNLLPILLQIDVHQKPRHFSCFGQLSINKSIFLIILFRHVFKPLLRKKKATSKWFEQQYMDSWFTLDNFNRWRLRSFSSVMLSVSWFPIPWPPRTTTVSPLLSLPAVNMPAPQAHASISLCAVRLASNGRVRGLILDVSARPPSFAISFAALWIDGTSAH